MENNLSKKPGVNQPVFFPYHFRSIGLIVFLSAFIFMALAKWLVPEFVDQYKGDFKDCFKSISLAGLFCFAWAKEKYEDEMTYTLRLKAISLAFYFVIGMILIEPFMRFLFGPGQIGTYRVVFMLLFFYLFFYYGSKWAAGK